MHDKLLTISEAARLIGLSPSTLRRLETSGTLSGYGLEVIYTPGGQRRYLANQIHHLYSRQGFAEPVGFGARPALLIRDLTKAFCDPVSRLAIQLERQIESTLHLIDAMKRRGFPIVFTRTLYDPCHGFSRLWQQKFPSIEVLVSNSDWIVPHSRLAGVDFDLENDTCYVSDLKQSPVQCFLDEHGVDTVILAGVTTSGCIRATAVEAFQTERRVIIPREAVGDRKRSLHDFTLLDLNARYADVMDLEHVLQRIATLA